MLSFDWLLAISPRQKASSKTIIFLESFLYENVVWLSFRPHQLSPQKSRVPNLFVKQ